MTKTIFSRVVWLGKATAFCAGLAVFLAVVLGVATTALAAVPGDPFKLGKINTIDRISQLAGSASTPMLRIDNNGMGSALQLLVEPGRTPLSVNAAAGKATNLNADRLDGLDQASFLRHDGKAADADKLDGKDSSDYTYGPGRTVDGLTEIQNGTNGFKLLTLPNLGNVTIDCNSVSGLTTVRYTPAPPSEGGDGTSHRVWRSDGSTVTHSLEGYGGPGAAISGGPTEQFTFQVQKYNARATIVVSTHSPSGGIGGGTCAVMGQAVITGAA